jgi:hypothetical protein
MPCRQQAAEAPVLEASNRRLAAQDDDLLAGRRACDRAGEVRLGGVDGDRARRWAD